MLKAGTGRTDVTPKKPMALWGYPHVKRVSTGVHDPLYATALCLDDGERKTVTISVDVAFITATLADKCRRQIEACTGIPPVQVMISATHTHSGPVVRTECLTGGDDAVSNPDSDYMQQLTLGIVDAVKEAMAALEPAELAAASVQVDGVGCNRIDPFGPYDPEAGLLVARRKADRSVLGIQMVYAMQPTVLHEDSTLVSADFPGYARQHIEAAFPGSRVIYLNGFCGNLSPRYHVKSHTFEEAERLGVRLGEFVQPAVEQLADAEYQGELSVSAQQMHAPLIPREYPSVFEAESQFKKARRAFEWLRAEGSDPGALRTAECAVFGAEEMLRRARAQSTGTLQQVKKEYANAEIQILRTGDLNWIGVPGKWFVEYSLEIKRKFPGKVFLVSLTNGELLGYITTPGTKGYEGRQSLFSATTGSRIMQSVQDLLMEK